MARRAGMRGRPDEKLDRIWIGLSSGSYLPRRVLRRAIPKDGGVGDEDRGIPTISDRIAQTVVKRYLETAGVEPGFTTMHMGLVPERSGIQALTIRRRCWDYEG